MPVGNFLKLKLSFESVRPRELGNGNVVVSPSSSSSSSSSLSSSSLSSSSLSSSSVRGG